MLANHKPLSPMEARFAHEYVVDFNASQAAIRAGYSPASAGGQGSRLLKRAHVAARIAELMDERNQATKIDAQWVLERLVELHGRCMQEVKPALDRKGKQLTDDSGAPLFTFNAAAANKALELIGKHVDVSAFEDRVAVSGELSLVARLQAGRERVRAKVIEGEVVSRDTSDPDPDPDNVAERLAAARKRGRPEGSYAALADARIVKSG